MIVKAIQRRLIKTIALQFSRDVSDALVYPWYYLPCEVRHIEEFVDATDAVCSLDQFPWPEDPCVLLSESPAYTLFSRLGIKLRTREALQAHVVSKGLVSLYLAELRETGGIRFTSVYEKRLLQHLPTSSLRPISEPDRTVVAKTLALMQQMSAHVEDGSPEPSAEAFGSIDDPFAVVSSAIDWACTPRGAHFFAVDGSFDKSLIQAAANIATPCHYKLKCTFPKSFGFGETKRLWRTKPIFAFVKYDRVFMQATGAGENEVPPHFRRGHVRHLWLQAGVDRFTLPADPHLRLQFATERKVRRVVVAPCWVGPRDFGDDGMRFEILPEDAG